MKRFLALLVVTACGSSQVIDESSAGGGGSGGSATGGTGGVTSSTGGSSVGGASVGGGGAGQGGKTGQGGQGGTANPTVCDDIDKPQIIDLTPKAFYYGLAQYQDTVLTSIYTSHEITAVSTKTLKQLSPPWPGSMGDVGVFGPHGLDVEPADGTIYLADLNMSRLLHFEANPKAGKLGLIEQFAIGKQPVNVIAHGAWLFVADREEETIYRVDKSPLGANMSKVALPGVKNPSAVGYSDLFVYNDKLFVAAEDIDGFVTMGLDLSSPVFHPLDKAPPASNDAPASGIYVLDDRVYLNRQWNITVTDLNGKIECAWDLVSTPNNVGYIDLLRIDGKWWTASWNNTLGHAHFAIFSTKL